LAGFVIGSDGSDGFCIAFFVKEYVTGKKGLLLNGAIVRIVYVFA
jgi:hypothetical protein